MSIVLKVVRCAGGAAESHQTSIEAYIEFA